jgi:hypothetical protein
MNVPQPSSGPVVTPSPTATPNPTPSTTANPTNTPTQTQTGTPNPTVTPSQTQTGTPNPTNTPTQTQTQTGTPNVTPSQTQTGTPNPTATPTQTQTQTGTPNVTPSQTQTGTPNPTATPTQTQTQTATPNPTGTPTPTPTILPGTTEARTYLSAVVDAGGTVTSPMSAATITMFTSIWSNELNTGMLYMYPFIGGTAGSNKFNALNPVDTNAGYRLTFNGGWTHSSSGATPNGVNAYANTFFTPNSAATLTISGGTLGFYSGTDSVGAFSKCAMGSKSNLSDGWALYPKSNANVIDAFAWENNTGAPTTATNPSSLGGLAFTRTGTTVVSYVRRGVLFENVTKTATAKSTQPIYLGALNSNGTDGQYSVFRHQFTYAHTGLTSAQISTLDTIIQTYQTSLSRNAY